MGVLVDLPGRERGWVSSVVVAREFSVSLRTVERWRAAGCPVLKAGGLVRFRLGEVEEWLRSWGGSC